MPVESTYVLAAIDVNLSLDFWRENVQIRIQRDLLVISVYYHISKSFCSRLMILNNSLPLYKPEFTISSLIFISIFSLCIGIYLIPPYCSRQQC